MNETTSSIRDIRTGQSEPISAKKHDQKMQIASDESMWNIRNHLGGPFGAVIVCTDTDEVLAVSANSVTTDCDPTAHAEINCIRKACKQLNRFNLTGYTIYTSCEPCPMCFGAIYWAHLDHVYYANRKEDAAAIGFDDSFIYDELKVDIYRRKVKFDHIPNLTAKEAFDVWKQRKDKVLY